MAICKAKFVAVHFNSEPLSQTAPVHDVSSSHVYDGTVECKSRIFLWEKRADSLPFHCSNCAGSAVN